MNRVIAHRKRTCTFATRLIVMTLAVFVSFLSLGAANALALSEDYTVINNKVIPIPKTYEFTFAINRIDVPEGQNSYFNQPSDLFVNKQGYLYVADTGNNRIVKLTPMGETLGIFTEAGGKPLKAPEGIFVDDNGNMFIADTGNLRIVHLSSGGTFVEEFIKPDSELLDEHFEFNSSKILVSPTGYLYMLKGENILTVDAYNRFQGYFGQTELGFNFINYLVRLFASDVQKQTMRKVTASTYISMDMDEKGIIYATSLDMKEGEIKKLNSIGKNIYVKYDDAQESFELGIGKWLTRFAKGDGFVFGERWNEYTNESIKPVFLDITVDPDGFITVIEKNTCKLYQYDQEANLLTVFGGKGSKQGRFDLPSAIETDAEGNIYVLDKGMGNIQVFAPTEFIKLIHEAIKMYDDGMYQESHDLWTQVLKIDENYQLAHKGIATTLYKQEKWKESMDEYRLAEYRAGYSKAFVEYRYVIVRQNFVWVLLALILVIIAIVFVIRLARRISEKAIRHCSQDLGRRMSVGEGIKLSLGAIFHPVDVFMAVKTNRRHLNYLAGVIILAFSLLARIVYIYTVSFPLADIDVKDSNIWLEAVKLLVPIITWVMASYIITSILDGESKIGEVIMVSCYCMVPYAILTVPLALLSNILSRNELMFYAVLFNGIWMWVIILLLVSFKTINDYSGARTLGISSLSALSMLLIWAVTILLYVTVGRLFQFIYGLFEEIRMVLL